MRKVEQEVARLSRPWHLGRSTTSTLFYEHSRSVHTRDRRPRTIPAQDIIPPPRIRAAKEPVLDDLFSTGELAQALI